MVENGKPVEDSRVLKKNIGINYVTIIFFYDFIFNTGQSKLNKLINNP